MTVETERQSRGVSGPVFADGRPRIVNIKGIRMDAEFGPSMIYITNFDKPGFIGKFSSTLGEAGINIATFHVGREAPGGERRCEEPGILARPAPAPLVGVK